VIWVAVVAFLVFAVASPGAVAGGLTVIGKPTVTLTFRKPAADRARPAYERAPLTIVLRNDGTAKGKVRASFLATNASGGPVPAVKPRAAAKVTRLVLVESRSLVLAPGQLGGLALELRRPVGSKGGAGLIVVQLDRRSSSTTTITAMPATGFEQKKVTLTATAWVGPVSRTCRRAFHWLFGDHCPGQHYANTTVTVVARGVSTRTTILSADSGRNLFATLRPASSMPDTSTTGTTASTETVAGSSAQRGPTAVATISVSNIPNPGKYSGDVAINPTATPPQAIATTVDAQDALIWPLIVLLLGAALGAVLTRRHDVRRGARLLRAALADAIAPYLKERKDRDQLRPNRFYLNDLLNPGDASQQPSFHFWNHIWHRPPQSEPKVPVLYRRTYRVKRTDELTQLADDIQEVIDRFTRWTKLNISFHLLHEAVSGMRTNLPVRNDGDRLLDLVEQPPADDAMAEDWVRRIVDHARLVATYRDVARRYDEREKAWRDKHTSVDPSMIYGHPSSDVLTRTPEQTLTQELDLLRAQRLLRRWRDIPDDPTAKPPPQVHLRGLARDLGEEDVAFAAGFTFPGSQLATRLVHPLILRLRSPEHIRRVVRQRDWAVFWLIAVLTALAYLLPFYVGKDYGSVTDYLAAFAAGATVPTAINWALYPPSRSTTAPATSPAPGDATAATAATPALPPDASEAA
jgi:hypothetical protein